MPNMSSSNRLQSQERSRMQSLSPAVPDGYASDHDGGSLRTTTSQDSFLPPIPPGDDETDEDEAAAQDIEELWFPGGHADLGGGWPVADGESPLSHGPLVWMVREVGVFRFPQSIFTLFHRHQDVDALSF